MDDDGVTFTVVDRYRRLAGLRLVQEIGLDDVSFIRKRTVWTLHVDRPSVDRMEYLFEIEDAQVQEQVKKPMADELLFGKLKNGGIVKIDIDAADKEKLKFAYYPEQKGLLSFGSKKPEKA